MMNPYASSAKAAQPHGDAVGAFLRILGHERFLLWCAAIFIVLRLPVILFLPVEPMSDAAWYFARAIGIVEGRGYVEGGLPTAYWPVGYPAFLAALFSVFGPHIIVGQLANVLLGLGVLVLIVRISDLMFADRAAGHLAALLFAVYPNQIAYTAGLVTETAFAFLFMLAIYVFVRGPGMATAAISGLIMGLATLTKTQTVFFPAFLIGVYVLQMRTARALLDGMRLGAVMYIALVLVLTPWALRNYNVLGVFTVSTNGGLALVAGNSPNATGDYIPDSAMPEGLVPSVADQVEIDRRAKAYAWNWIKENPDRFLALMPRKVWRLWAPDGEGEWWFQGGYKRYGEFVSLFRGVRIVNQAFYAVLILCFAASFATLWRRGKLSSSWISLGFVFALYTTALSAVFSGQSRYHHPVMPWIVMYAAWQLLEWLRARRLRPQGAVSH
jgi:4-amino-4-deoxy-L-arabinose transferase-like glycosyltransferase